MYWRHLFLLIAYLFLPLVSMDELQKENEFYVGESMRVSIIQPGEDCSPGVEEDSIVHVHYTTKIGELTSYSTRQQREPIVIDMKAVHEEYSWEEALIGMCPGEARIITITPKPGQPHQENDRQETVIEVELIRIDPSHHHQHDHIDSFSNIDADKSGIISWEEMEAHVKKHQSDYSIDDEPIETIVSEIFQEEDSNKDGEISQEEFYRDAEPENLHTEL